MLKWSKKWVGNGWLLGMRKLNVCEESQISWTVIFHWQHLIYSKLGGQPRSRQDHFGRVLCKPLTRTRTLAWVLGRNCHGTFDAFAGWQTADSEALKTRGHWLESLVEAATEHLMHLRAGSLGSPQKPRHPSEAFNNRGHWLESLVEAATEHLMHLRAGKRQPPRPLTTEGTGLSPWSKLPRNIWCICGLANGSLGGL